MFGPTKCPKEGGRVTFLDWGTLTFRLPVFRECHCIITSHLLRLLLTALTRADLVFVHFIGTTRLSMHINAKVPAARHCRASA